MLYQWTSTRHGKIWLDGDAFTKIAAKRLPKDFVCQNLTFSGEQSLLSLYILPPEGAAAESKESLIDALSSFFAPAGITVRIHWVAVLDDEAPRGRGFWQRPLFWTALAAVSTSAYLLGGYGILKVAAVSSAALLASWSVSSGAIARGFKHLSKMLKERGR